jgi:hypothetical protein
MNGAQAMKAHPFIPAHNTGLFWVSLQYVKPSTMLSLDPNADSASDTAFITCGQTIANIVVS